jgi:hypothetical protein
MQIWPILGCGGGGGYITLLPVRCLATFPAVSWGRILGRNPDKSRKSFASCYSPSPLQFCLEISISSNSRNLLQFLQENLIENIPPSLWFKKSTQKPQIWELTRLWPETSTKLYVHEFGFYSRVSVVELSGVAVGDCCWFPIAGCLLSGVGCRLSMSTVGAHLCLEGVLQEMQFSRL